MGKIKQYKPTALGEVLELCLDLVPVEPHVEYKISGVYSFGKGLLTRKPIMGSETTYKKMVRLHANDFVLSKLKGWEGAIARIPEELDGYFLSPQFATFRLKPEKAETGYLEWFFKQSHVWEDMRGVSRGMGARRDTVPPEKFLSLKIPLPPISEQRRIVARIEELAAKIEEARRLREKAQTAVNAFQQSIASKLFEKQLKLFSAKIGDFCDVRGGIQKCSARTPNISPRRYLTVAHVQRNFIDITDPRYFEVTDEELERWRLLSGDVLVIEGNGSADQIGRAALFSGELENCVHQNHVIRIRVDKARLLPEYLNAFLNSSAGQATMLENSRTTSGLFNLSVGRIREISIPIPAMNLQLETVEHLNHFQVKMNELGKYQLGTKAELDALLPSILDRAFKGEL